MVAGTGSSSSPATTSPWPAPARVHPNIPLFRGAHAGSTKVLATKGSGKTPAVYAGVASAVAFMAPKRRQPPVFYFSSMMAADAEALATDSSLSMHPSFCLCLHGVAACTGGAAAGTGGAPTDTGGAATLDTGGAVRRGSNGARTAAMPAWSNSPLLIKLNWSGELLNYAPAWGGNWLHRAKRGW